LKRGEKEKYVAMVEELWGRVKEKRKEKKQQFVDWLSKQKDGLDKLRAVKQKAEEALDRIRKNLEENRSRLTDARSGDFADKVQIWVKESEEKEADILKSISDLNHKIDEIEGKLKKHGMM
jgi:translation initiation factor 2B subunit (eIF-2B alpha/beta/delta family)